MATMESEPDPEGLLHLLNQQEGLELAAACVQGEAGEMREKAYRLVGRCPGLARRLGQEIEGTLQASEELAGRNTENRARLRQVSTLETFFRSYLAMISWTEGTRSSIFSDGPLTVAKSGEERLKMKTTVGEDLDRTIEQKFEEFEELVKAGLKLVEEEHRASVTIKERLQELKSMLVWILVCWQSQKEQRRKREGEPADSQSRQTPASNLHSNLVSPSTETTEDSSVPETRQRGGYTVEISVGSSTQLPQPGAETGGTESPSDRLLAEMFRLSDEVQLSEIASRPRETDSEEAFPHSEPLEETLVLEPPNVPLVVTGRPGLAPLGGRVNLILSIGRKGDHRPQGRSAESSRDSRNREQVHRVSAYLQVNEQENVKKIARQSLPLAHGFCVEDPQTKACSVTKVSSLSFPTRPKPGTNSIFSSLKRRGRRAKVKDCREAVQKVTSPRLNSVGTPVGRIICSHNTWPPKTKKSGLGGPSPSFADVENPLAEDIDKECAPGSSKPNLSWSSTGLTWIAAIPRYPSLHSAFSPECAQCPDLVGLGSQRVRKGASEEGRNNGYPDGEAKWRPDRFVSKVTEDRSTIGGVQCPGKMAPDRPVVKQQEPKDHGEICKEIPKGATGQQSINPWLQHPIPELDPDHLKSHGSDSVFNRDDRPRQRLQCRSSAAFTDFKLCRESGTSALHEQIGDEWDKLAALLKSSGQLNWSGTEYQQNGLTEGGEVEQPSGPDHPGTDTPGELERPTPSDSREEISDYLSESEVDNSRDILDPATTQTHHLTETEVIRSSVADHVECEVPRDCPKLRSHRDQLASKGAGSLGGREEEGLCEGPAEMSENPTLWECGDKAPRILDTSMEVFHPDHEQFEEDEKELEEIWSKTDCSSQSICSDIMYTTCKRELAKNSTGNEDFNRTPTSRKLVTTSAPNLFVCAEVRLQPRGSQAKQGLEGEWNTGSGMAGQNTTASRRSWAAHTHHGQDQQMASLHNETASNVAKVPCIMEQEKYIYKYGDEEEETSNQEVPAFLRDDGWF
ncbi:uncharacterized protein [Heptranchias perlo]|uniref:uncharacterized protein n=1 Tax=Heptranchias perlo TaxID=212740 RepID=UPI0035598252